MNYQTVRLVSTLGSGSCVSSFGSSPTVETAAVSSFGLTKLKVVTADTFPVLGRFHFWVCTNVNDVKFDVQSRSQTFRKNTEGEYQ